MNPSNVGDDKGLQMALGNIDINTMERIDNFNPDKPAAQVCIRNRVLVIKPMMPCLDVSFCSYQSKHRSRGWSDAPATTGRSIWCAGPASASAVQPRSPDSTRRPASTRGKERVISLGGLQLPSRELQVKRSREGANCSKRVLSNVNKAPRVRLLRHHCTFVSQSPVRQTETCCSSTPPAV